jgi:hypothetical protein
VSGAIRVEQLANEHVAGGMRDRLQLCGGGHPLHRTEDPSRHFVAREAPLAGLGLQGKLPAQPAGSIDLFGRLGGLRDYK